MFEALKDIACFVTAFVSFIYGTRVAWGCGKQCQFREPKEGKVKLLLESIPATTLIYFFGFLIVFSYLFDSYLSRIIVSLTSSIVLAHLVVSMAMPELKRKPGGSRFILAELIDGSMRWLVRQTLDESLSLGKIARFKRTDGWAVVGRDPLRKSKNSQSYSGTERREIV